VETTLKFNQFQRLLTGAIARVGEASSSTLPLAPDQVPSLVLAYIGDAWFSLYVRTQLLGYESRQVRVLHTLDATVISATMQAHALRLMETMLKPEELEIVRRGRNAKSRTPKSASVQDYHSSTGFESLLGYLFLEQEQERLEELSAAAFAIITQEIAAKIQRGGKK
jgi:ribonuclease-3 family protein